MKLNTATYDVAQWFVRIFLPALATLYAGLSELWGLPKAIEVVGTIGAVTLFLGAILSVSSSNFKKENEPNAGFIKSNGRDPDTGLPNLDLVITQMPDDLLNKKTITLHVDEVSENKK